MDTVSDAADASQLTKNLSCAGWKLPDFTLANTKPMIISGLSVFTEVPVTKVRCEHCYIVLKDWNLSDDALLEHLWYSNMICPHLSRLFSKELMAFTQHQRRLGKPKPRDLMDLMCLYLNWCTVCG